VQSKDHQAVVSHKYLFHLFFDVFNLFLCISFALELAAMIGGAIAGITGFLFILTGLLVIAYLSYQHFRRIQLRNQLHEPECKW